jgi:hypothetical protein
MRTTVASCFTLVLVGALWLTWTASHAGAGPSAMAALALVGLGIGPAASTSLLGPQSAVTWAQRGSVTSAIYAMRMLGGSLAVMLLGGVPGASAEAAATRFAGVAVLAVFGLATAVLRAPRVLTIPEPIP